jgi:formylglycine-generating enzyme required for sulfatase activity
MSFGANELGLYDLGGNVWELCHDWYDDSEEKRRVMRGGSRLLYGESNYLLSCWRASDFAVTRGISRGFRCVLE